MKAWKLKQIKNPVDLAAEVGIGFVIGVLSGVAF